MWRVVGLVLAQQDRLSRRGCVTQQDRLSRRGCVVGGGFGPGLTGQAVKERLCGSTGQAVKERLCDSTGQAVKERLCDSTGQAVKEKLCDSTGQAVKERLCDSAGQAVKERLCDSAGQAVKERLCGGWRVWSRLNRTGCVVGGGFGPGSTGQAVQDRQCGGWWGWSRLNRTGCQGEAVLVNRTGCQGEAVWWVVGLVPAQQDRLSRTGCVAGGGFGPGSTGQAVKERLCGGWWVWSRPVAAACGLSACV